MKALTIMLKLDCDVYNITNNIEGEIFYLEKGFSPNDYVFTLQKDDLFASNYNENPEALFNTSDIAI